MRKLATKKIFILAMLALHISPLATLAQSPPSRVSSTKVDKAPPEATTEHSKQWVIWFKNGDLITADLVKWEKGRVYLKSPYFAEEISFSTKLITKINLKQSISPRAQPKHQATITLNSKSPKGAVNLTREMIIAKVQAISKESITIKTAYCDRIVLPRKMIKYFHMDDLSSILLTSPYNLNSWQSYDDQIQWSENKGILTSKGTAHISKAVKLTPKSHISFALLSSSKKLNLWLYASKFSSKTPSSRYDLNISSSSFTLQKVKNGQLKRLRKILPKRRTYPSKRVKYDIYTNLDKGEISIYTDGVLSKTYVDDEPRDKDLGSDLHLLSPRFPQEVRSLKVRKWSGVLPTRNKNLAEILKARGDKLILINGDLVTGDVMSIQDERIKIKTPHSKLQVPLHKIATMKSDLDSRASTTRYADIYLVSEENDRIAVKFLSLNGTDLKVEHALFGEKTFDIRAFSFIVMAR